MQLTDEMRYRLLKMIEANPGMSQREIADELGISLGKVNYCLRALIGRGLVKVRNFKNSRHKLAYLYLLTPKGAEEKARVTYRFLRQRLAEIETLKAEIAELKRRASEGEAWTSDATTETRI